MLAFRRRRLRYLGHVLGLRIPADMMVRCALMALQCTSDYTLASIQRAACSVTARASRCHNSWQWRRIVQCGVPKWRPYRDIKLHHRDVQKFIGPTVSAKQPTAVVYAQGNSVIKMTCHLQDGVSCDLLAGVK